MLELQYFWPPDEKSWLLRKDPDAGKDWRQEEKGTTEDEMPEWHHQLNAHEFEQAHGDGDGQGSLACCSPWVAKSWTHLATEKQQQKNDSRYCAILQYYSRAQSCWLFATAWTVAHQTPLSMGFFRQEYWSGLPFPSPRDLPNSGIEPKFPLSLALQADSLATKPLSNFQYWSGLPFPSPEDLPNPGIKPWSPTSQADSLLFELQGSPGSDGKASVYNAGDLG